MGLQSVVKSGLKGSPHLRGLGMCQGLVGLGEMGSLLRGMNVREPWGRRSSTASRQDTGKTELVGWDGSRRTLSLPGWVTSPHREKRRPMALHRAVGAHRGEGWRGMLLRAARAGTGRGPARRQLRGLPSCARRGAPQLHVVSIKPKIMQLLISFSQRSNPYQDQAKKIFFPRRRLFSLFLIVCNYLRTYIFIFFFC